MRLLCNYYVTLKCNAKCEFCNIWQDKDNFHLQEQTLTEIENNLRALKKLGVKIIDFTGGEPLLYPHLIEALHLAKKYGFYTTITTNCSLYPQYATRLNGLVNMLFFSLQSTEETVHNAITQANLFAKVIESIKITKQIKQKVSLLHTVTDTNVKSLVKMVDFAQQNKCVLRINPCFSYFSNTELAKTFVVEIKKQSEKPYVAVNLALLKFIEDGGNQINNPACQAVKSTVVISPDNHLILPCFHHALQKIKIENNLWELHNQTEIKNMEKQVGKFTFCQDCKITCYMRASLLKKYPYLTIKSWLQSLKEMMRKQT